MRKSTKTKVLNDRGIDEPANRIANVTDELDMALNTERIVNNIQKLRKLLKRRSKLRRPEGVHELRTRTRRLEAVLPATGLDSGRNEKEVLRLLKPMRKKAGAVRDMDVLTALLLQFHVDEDERDCEVQLVEHLGAQRYRQGKTLRRIAKANAGELRLRLKSVASEITAISSSQRDSASGETAPRENAAVSALELASELADPKILNRRNLHSYRKKVKQLRYVLKSAQGEDGRDFIDALGECKDAIGEWHDWEELVSIAGDILNHGRRCQLINQLKRFSSSKFDEALSITNAMRRRFVEKRTRRKSKKRAFGISHPGLFAADAIARPRVAPRS
jgi:CHAD domain-containing protein